MTILKNEHLRITQADHDKLINYITNGGSKWSDSETQKEVVCEKLITANIISDADFPRDVSRLYSTITVRDTIARINRDYKLLPPKEVNSTRDGVSVLSPFGFALLGRQVGSSFTWQFNNKRKYFHVVEIRNPISESYTTQ